MKRLIKRLFGGKAIKNLVIYAAGQAVNLISPILLIPHIVDICGESNLGKAGVGFSFALIAIVFVDYGSYINGTRDISINNSEPNILQQHFSTIYLSKFLLLLGAIAISSTIIISIPFFQRDSAQLFLSLLIVAGQFINPTWFLQGMQDFVWISIINIVSKIIYIALVLTFITKPDDYIYVNAFLGTGSIIASSAGLIWVCWKYKMSLKHLSLAKAVNLIRVEFSLTISQLFLSFYQYAPILIVSFVCGDFYAGQYRIIDQIVMVFRTYFTMFFNFAYADICLKISKNLRNGIVNWAKLNSGAYLIALLFLLVIYIYATEVLLYFNVGTEQLFQLTKMFKLGLLLPLAMGISIAVKQLMFSCALNRPYIRITIISTLLTLAVLFLILRYVGIVGAYYVFIFSELLISIFYFIVIRNKMAATTINS